MVTWYFSYDNTLYLNLKNNASRNCIELSYVEFCETKNKVNSKKKQGEVYGVHALNCQNYSYF